MKRKELYRGHATRCAIEVVNQSHLLQENCTDYCLGVGASLFIIGTLRRTLKTLESNVNKFDREIAKELGDPF